MFNLLLAPRLGVVKLKPSPHSLAALFEPVFFAGLTVPRFIRELDTAMGPGFFERTRVGRKARLSVQHHILEFVLFACQQDFGTLTRLPDYLCELFGQPVQWSFSDRTEAVPLALSVILAIAKDDTSHPLAPANMPPRTDYVSALAWFVRWTIPSLKGFVLPEWLREVIDAPAETILEANALGITRLLEGLYWSTDEARQLFDISTRQGRLDLVVWFVRWIAPQLEGYRHPDWVIQALEGVARSDEIVRHALRVASDLAVANATIEAPSGTAPAGAATKSAVPIAAQESRSSAGVNLVGWARAELGIGEDVRQAALALRSGRTPFCIIDAAESTPPASRQADVSVVEHLVADRRYATDLVFLDASTQFRYYARARLRGEQLARPTIGVCPWELPRWPDSAAFAVKNLDYFWAASGYIFKAFLPHFPPERLMLAPPAVELAESRADDLIPADLDGPLRFLTVFDGLSSIDRKNPMAAIRAFRHAFPRSRDVRLTVKYMNLDLNSAALQALRGEIDGDERIEEISRTLLKSELVSLIRACHCFVSLHRAEGFGRNVAESMLLGRPVICSRYSGNLDFCTDANSYLVDGRMIGVGANQYALAGGQEWFDPSVEDAATQMRKIHDDWREARRRAAAGRDHIRTHHSAAQTGQRYRHLIKATIGW